MRIPYCPDPPNCANAEEEAIVQRVRDRRAPRPLQPLDLALLHAPQVANGWNSFLGAVRTKTSLSDDVREVMIARVAVVNGAWYEWAHHAPLAIQGGIAQSVMDSVVKSNNSIDIASKDRQGLTDKQWAALVYADEMTRNVKINDQTFDVVKDLFDEKEIVEMTAIVACYNCVSRFLVALDVGERNSLGPDAASH